MPSAARSGGGKVLSSTFGPPRADPLNATYSRRPSGLTRRPRGRLPTGTERITVSDAPSMNEMSFDASLLTSTTSFASSGPAAARSERLLQPRTNVAPTSAPSVDSQRRPRTRRVWVAVVRGASTGRPYHSEQRISTPSHTRGSNASEAARFGCCAGDVLLHYRCRARPPLRGENQHAGRVSRERRGGDIINHLWRRNSRRETVACSG
jgi:hypothetical protein